MVNSPPNIARFATNLYERLVQMPLLIPVRIHSTNPLSADLRDEHRTKCIPPISPRLIVGGLRLK